jgi:NhaP-type Na+/H+ or K+/H+ antiporter
MSIFDSCNPREWTEYQTIKNLRVIGNVIIMFFAFWALVFALGFDFMLPPNGPMWATILIWSASFIFGKAFEKMSIPALLGMLISGILLKNLPDDPVSGLPDSWSAQFRAFGLSLILMRSGLELDIPMVKKQGWIAARLTVCPGVAEAFTVCGMCMYIFSMPFALALSCGFILAAVSPAVVVSGMFDLHKRGYGVAKGLPSLVVAAASFDDVVAISGFAMCIGVAIESDEDPILAAMHGPINLIGGCTLGYIGGHIAGCTKLWSTKRKRFSIVLALGLFFMFASASVHFNGGGAMAGLMTGIFASMCWQNGWCGELSSGPSKSFHHEVENSIARLWDIVAQPLLFGVIGASVDFRELDMSVLPNAITCVIVAMCVRVPIAFIVTGGKDFTVKERAFIGLSWIPKATVQAALGSAPLDLIREKIDHDDPDFEEWEKWGKEILVTAVVSILLTAPIGLVCISKLGPRWLHQDKVDSDELEPSHHAVAVMNDKTVDINESWAINERNRRDDDNVIAVRKRTQAIRFFSKLREQMVEIDKILARDNNRKTIDPNSTEDVLLSEIETSSPTKSPLNSDLNDEEEVVKTGLSHASRKEIAKHMAILEEGIDSVMRVVEDNIEFVPTADLFLTPEGNYKDVPTYQEMTSRLHGILNDAQSDEFDGTPDASGVPRRGRMGSFNLGSKPNLPMARGIQVQHSARSFSGYKATNQEIELFKQEHQSPSKRSGAHEI